MIPKEVITDKLKAFIKEKGSLRKAAREIGVSHAYIFDILRENRPISTGVARFFGYKKVYPPRPAPYFVEDDEAETAAALKGEI